MSGTSTPVDKPPQPASAAGSAPDMTLAEKILSVPADPRANKPRNEFEKSTDYANYFITYGFICHQKQMLEDAHRMDSYHRAITSNPGSFKDKVVLDLGCGTGVLAIWAAQAGAKKVYAVEATPMARFAEKLVAANGLADVIEVIQGKIEDLPIPALKADVMVSEWMGYLLLRESMLDSVVYARDKWMASDGAMFPSHATIFLAPVRTNDTEQASKELTREIEGWGDFVEKTKDLFSFDLSALQEDFQSEQRVYHMQTVAWRDLQASSIVGQEAPIMTMDLHTVTVDDYRQFSSDFSCLVRGVNTATALAGWFECEFNGSATLPTKHRVRLSTAPSPHGTGTHWGQQLFYLHPQVKLNVGDRILGKISMERNAYNHRLLDFELDYAVKHRDGKETDKATVRYVLE